MKVVVTGVGGFVGQHLVRELVGNGHNVIGLGLGSADWHDARLMTDYLAVDLRNSWPLIDCDAVVHLAALSAVGPSFTEPQRYIEANSAPLTHMGEALLTTTRRARILVVSTGAVYQGPSGSAWKEDTRILPSSPYIVSKLVTEMQSAYYQRRGLDIVVMRPFNHIGPGQRTGFLLPDLVEGVRTWIQTGAPLSVGNLGTRRDYTDVRDVVRAYRLALEAPQLNATIFNVCSGKSVSGHELLASVTRALSPGRPPEIVVDESKLRPGDPEEIRGDNTAINTALGWRPTIPTDQSVRDVIVSATDDFAG